MDFKKKTNTCKYLCTDIKFRKDSSLHADLRRLMLSENGGKITRKLPNK